MRKIYIYDDLGSLKDVFYEDREQPGFEEDIRIVPRETLPNEPDRRVIQ